MTRYIENAKRGYVSSMVTDVEGPWVAYDDYIKEHDHLRALLMLAYDQLMRDSFDKRGLLLQSIADAVSSVGRVTAADVQWARKQLNKPERA